ncbi:cysteine desulfurase-like protein [Lignipirellula cremea]|uniref:Putative cysteine desulfurase n=1 Tax=Lignipirellula cremea TaxID=2528010 RepID=A0A518DTI4_9BACT|nr:cysteine desulfurase-like protein [Lignipirellula cremea]QDU95151.1 putative cysteine desulfurase [Lignipirellula cremea]
MYTDEMARACRRQFPALSRQVGKDRAIYFDGPAGTQVPQRVIEAISDYLAHHNANHGGLFASSRESDAILDRTHQAMADFVGSADPDQIVFGPNMTTLTFAMSRALSRTWKAGDEVIVTRLDHDANVSPWVLAAADVGAVVRYVEVDPATCTLDLDSYYSQLNERTRLVAVGCASNSVGTINPVRAMADAAHQQNALVYADAVHYAPHALLDVAALGCDFLACSAYKFFGPHIGVLWGRRELLEQTAAYKLRPAPDELPGKWMTGTQNHECLAGVLAAVDYLAEIGRTLASDDSLDRRHALASAFTGIAAYERGLLERLLQGLESIDEITVWGLTDPARMDERLPTISITHSRLTATQLATALGNHGVFVWHGNYYALQLTESLGLEPEGMVRIGLVHYNTTDEVDRLIELLGGALNV